MRCDQDEEVSHRDHFTSCVTMTLMFFISAILLILANFTATSSLSDVATYRETSFELEHFLYEKFTGRSSYVIKHQRDGSREISLVDSSRNSILSTQLPEFKALLANKGLYRIQVIFSNEDGTTTSASTAIPVCDLQQSGFKEDIVLHLDNYTKLMSVSYSSPAMAISQACNPNKVQFVETLI